MQKSLNINKDNYELFAVDYIDGNLNATDMAIFDSFLKDNPEIASDFDGLINVLLVDESVKFTAKDTLKRLQVIEVEDITESNYEDLFVANYEGDLTPEQEDSLKIFLKKNPQLIKEYELHGNLFLKPEDVVFENKSKLKHNSRFIIPRFISIAASLILLVVSWFILSNYNRNSRTNNFMVVSTISPRSCNSLSVPNIAVALVADDRAVVIKNDFVFDKPDALREPVSMSAIASKHSSEKLVNAYDYARIVRLPHGFDSKSEKAYKNPLLAEGKSKHEQKGLLSKIFGKQIRKIRNYVKIKRTNNSDVNEPKYVKLIDRSLLVFNTITGTESSTSKTYTADGTLVGYKIEGREVLLNNYFKGNSSK